MNLAIILVNYRTEAFLERNLRQLEAEGILAAAEVWVVDNGQNQKAVKQLGNRFSGIKLLENKRNIGFGAACNRAALFSRKKTLLFLNPDCFITFKAIQSLANILKKEQRLGLLAPRVLKENGEGQRWSYTAKPDLWQRVFSGQRRADLGFKACQSVEWVSGACFLAQRSRFMALGGFDENFGVYFEDRDLCLRAWQRGWGVGLSQENEVLHLESKSKISWRDRKKRYYAAQSYFFDKHYGVAVGWVMRFLRFPLYLKNVYL